jgi:hypothetical protein
MEKGINNTNKHNGKDSLSTIYLEFMKIFNVDSQEKLLEYLSRINIVSNEVCAKVLKGGKDLFL